MTVKNYHERNHWAGTAAEMAACNPGNPAAIWFIDSGASAGDTYWWDGTNWLPIGGPGVGPPTEGPGIDIIGPQVGLGGDTVLLYDSGGNPVAEFATLTLALAAATSHDIVVAPAGVFTENITIPSGVSLTGRGNKTYIIGTVTLGGDGSTLKSMIVIPTVNQAGTIIGIIGPSVGLGYVNDCSVEVINNGAGNAHAVQLEDGDLLIWSCYLQAYPNGGGDAFGVWGDTDKVGICHSSNNTIYAISASGLGYGYGTDGTEDMWVYGGSIIATTAPVKV